MSNLIKAGDVVIGIPRALEFIMPVTKTELIDTAAEEEKKRAEQAAKEERTADILSRAKFEARGIFEHSRKKGVIDGFAKGMEEQKLVFAEKKQQAEKAASAEIGRAQDECGNTYRAAEDKINNEARDFAFMLASKILNKKIDEDDPGYTDLFEDIEKLDGRLFEEEQPEELPQEIPENFAETAAEEAAATETKVGSVIVNQGEAAPAATAAENASNFIININNLEPSGLKFEDIGRLDAEGIHRFLREVNIRELVVALKGADRQVADFVMSGMTESIKETIREEYEFLGPIRVSEVEEAKQKVVKTMKRLLDSGDIEFSEGEKDGYVV